jgi:hypothetical protein
MPNVMRRTRVREGRLRWRSNLVVFSRIPCPCPPGKGPRTPLVTHLFDGKSSYFRFTFNQLSHFLRLMCYCWSVPLSHSHQLQYLGLTVLLGPMVLRCLGRPYGPLSFFTPRGPLERLGTSLSGTQTACALGNQRMDKLPRIRIPRHLSEGK